MDVKIEASSISELQNAAEDALRALEDIGFNDEATDMLVVLEQYLASLNIRIQFWDMGEGGFQAIHLFGGEGAEHIIAINERFKDISIPGNRIFAKTLFCHELAHWVLNHPPGYALPDQPDAVALNIHRALTQYASDPDFFDSIEMKAEVFATALGFWPQNRFLQLFVNTDAQFRDIANHFKMPLDCAVKWAVISLDAFPMHYLKYQPGDPSSAGLIIDHSVPATYSFFPWELRRGDVFSDSKTVAFRCASLREDDFGETEVIDPKGRKETFFCRAFFMKKEHNIVEAPDKIIVAGFTASTHNTLKNFAASAKDLQVPERR